MNEFQTTVDDAFLKDMPEEVKDQFFDCLNNVPLIRWLVSDKRPRAKDLERDEKGRIKVDITKPHILEDMDYFRPVALQYARTGRVTSLRPNTNPASEYGRWIREEVRRCYEGYVRERDGEWVPGYLYWFLNYSPIKLIKVREGSKRGDMVFGMPKVWEGIYLRYHALQQAEDAGLHFAELASRGVGKAHPYDQDVYTPNGWKKWGDIKVGDSLWGSDGNPVEVIAIPFEGRADIYEIELCDGRKVRASGGHDWVTTTGVVSTEGLKGKHIKLTKANFRSREVLEDPREVGARWAKEGEAPWEYIINDEETRWELLKGYVNAVGSVRGGDVVIRKPKDGLMFLMRSLGIYCVSSQYFLSANIDRPVFAKAALNRHMTCKIRKDVIVTKVTRISRQDCKCVSVARDGCYQVGEFVLTHNSYSMASILSHLFVLGENKTAKEHVTGIVTAYLKEYLTKDGILNKFTSMIDWCAENTQFPRRRLTDSMVNMTWSMGYKDADTNVNRGTQNTVIGVATSDESDKLRGKRAAKILMEEMGSYPSLIDTYNTIINSVSAGGVTYGQIVLVGTAGNKDSDFSGAQELMYNPLGYKLLALDNVYDKGNQGKPNFVYFFPGYMNLEGCYNEDGVSDVTKALKQILMNRHTVKYHSSDPQTIIRITAEVPITPSEAIMRVGVNMFPVNDINKRIEELDGNPSAYDDVYTGTLQMGSDGKVSFAPGRDPIREFPHKNNKLEGAVEIFVMPEIDKKTGKAYSGRYIGGLDPVDDDYSNTMSLVSMFVLDLWTDKIVAEYTGRMAFADDTNEICRRLALFYNARINYENNKKGIYSYFATHNSVWLLTDELDYLKDKQLVRERGYGNKSKGTYATAAINAFGRQLLRQWLIRPVTEGDNTVPALYQIRSRALLKELALWNDVGNFDRVSAMGMLMLMREDKMISFQGNVKRETQKDYLGNDPFFTRNYIRGDSEKKRMYEELSK